MSDYALEIELLSDAAFGRGDGVAGWVDAEIQHDPAGLPVLSGRALKGLLVAECAEILNVLPEALAEKWQAVALRLFGEPGATGDGTGGVGVGGATVAPDLAAMVWEDFRRGQSREAVLESLTAVRRQTAVDAETGAPRDETLRATRLVVRGLTLFAPLSFEAEPTETDKALLAACVMSLRRAGTGRNRGKGRLRARITNAPLDPGAFAAEDNALDLTPAWLEPFDAEVAA